MPLRCSCCLQTEGSDKYDVRGEYAGSIRATSCATIAFLCCHPIGAVGTECLSGPHRRVGCRQMVRMPVLCVGCAQGDGDVVSF